MRIAHLNLIQQPLTGVNKKLASQARAAQRAGLDVEFLVLNDSIESQSANLRYVPIQYTAGRRARWLKERTFRKLSLIERSVKLDRYDCIVMRYQTHLFDSTGFMEQYRSRILTEHHTKDVAEILLYNSKKRFLWAIAETITGPRFLRQVTGLIGVTDEIRLAQLERSGPKPSTVISNGVDVESTPFSGHVRFDGGRLVLIFVATDFAPWQGLDRLLSGLSRYSGRVQIELIVVGRIYNDMQHVISRFNNARVTIAAVGTLHSDALEVLFARSNVAISTLAAYRKQMCQICALKTREYMARGIPFVYAHDDPDVPVDAPFALRLPNDATPIDIDAIVHFAEVSTADVDRAGAMRAYARDTVDWTIKLTQMVRFATTVCAPGEAARSATANIAIQSVGTSK